MTGAVAHARAGGADPQSGPAIRRGVSGFFHYDLRWVVAEPGSIIGLKKSHYINRHDERASPVIRLLRQDGEELGSNAEKLSGYVNRDGETQSDELGPHVLITRGLPVRTGAQLARLLDARERRADRSYRAYGGRMPRVACHAIVSFRYGVSLADAERTLREHARLISDRLRVPVEARIHLEDFKPDHAHMLIGTRVVENGKLGAKQRALDAVSEKHDGRGVTIDGRVLGGTVEMLRSDWAERMRQASGDLQIDHRSYVRRGIPVYPVTNVPRTDIEYERRRGQETWREKRRLELDERKGVAFDLKLSEPAEAEIHSAIVVDDPLIDTPPDSARVDAEPKISELKMARQTAPPSENGWDEHDGLPSDPGLDTGPVSLPGGVDDSHADRRSAIASPEQTDSSVVVVLRDDSLSSFGAAYAELRRQHRLTADREHTLAALAGVDVSTLTESAHDAVSDDASAGQGRPSPKDWPPDLLLHWEEWAQQDRTARAARRSQKVASSKAAGPAAQEVAQSEKSAPLSPAALVEPDGSRSPLRLSQPARSGRNSDINAAIGSAAEPELDIKAGPDEFARSDVLARALGDAHCADIITCAYVANREPPSDIALLEMLGLRLWASGHDRDEVVRCLRARPPAAGACDDAEISRIVVAAFSQHATAWLATRPDFCARATRISRRVEVVAYRSLRNDALAQLKRELNEVWTTRNARVDDVMARHRRDMAWIRDLRWQNARLRRRGLVLAILSVAVEIGILMPLLAIEKINTEQRRQDLDAAARAATERLRALRDEWRAAHGVQRLPSARQGVQAPDESGPIVARPSSPEPTTTAPQQMQWPPSEALHQMTMGSVGPSGSSRDGGSYPPGLPLVSEATPVTQAGAAPVSATNKSVERTPATTTRSSPHRPSSSPDPAPRGEGPQEGKQKQELRARPVPPEADTTTGAKEPGAERPAPDENSHACQIAWNRDPCFASNTDPLEDRAELIHVGA